MPRIASTTSSGVTAPGGGMTLDALMRRQRELAERQAALSGPNPGSSTIAGGLGQMVNAAFTGMQQRRARQQEAEGRQTLAQLLSGYDPAGADAQSVAAQAYTLDPDLSLRLMEGAAQARAQAAEAQAAIANREDLQTFQQGQTQAQIAATREEGNLTREQQRTLQQQRLDAETKQAEREAELAASKPQSTVAQINADLAAKRITPEEAELAIKKATAIPQVGGTAADRKALWEMEDAYIGSTSAINQLKRASDLLSQGINTGYTAGLKTMFDKSGSPIGADPEVAKRTDLYNSIMNHEAIMAMAQALKGATTNTEMAAFVEIMNNPTVDPAVKQEQIDTMIAKAQSHNQLQASRIKSLDPSRELPTVGPADPSGAAEGEEALLQGARDAIAKGADAALVRKRLVDRGVDPGKL